MHMTPVFGSMEVPHLGQVILAEGSHLPYVGFMTITLICFDIHPLETMCCIVIFLAGFKGYFQLVSMLRFGYLGKWSPCAYESLSTKGEDFYPHTLLYDSNFTLN